MFFALLFIADLVISVLLVLLVLSSARRSLRYEVRRPVLYLLPVIATLILMAHTVLFTAPRLLDLQQLVLDPPRERTITVTDTGRLRSVRTEEERLYLVPGQPEPEAGQQYVVRVAEHSRIILEISPAEATD